MPRRVLIVEDIEQLRDDFAWFLQSEGYVVDIAGDLTQALSRVRSTTYHVAVIDIMLAGDDPANREGLKVIEELRRLDEGTLSIAVSNQDSPQLAADVIQRLHAFSYLAKDRIYQQGYEVLGDLVRQAAETVELRLFGTISDRLEKNPIMLSAIDYVAAVGPKRTVLSNNWAAHLGHKVYPLHIESMIDSLLPPCAPLLPERAADQYLVMHSEPACLVGTFWSKALSTAVTLLVCPSDRIEQVLSGDVLPDCTGANEIPSARAEVRNLIGLVFRRADLSLERFTDKVRPWTGSQAGGQTF